MKTMIDTLELVLDEMPPILPLCLSTFLFTSASRFVWKVFKGDFGCGSYSSASDYEKPIDMPFNDFEPEEETEETEEELSIKWTCDYCGSVHINTDCVCDACGGRRLRW